MPDLVDLVDFPVAGIVGHEMRSITFVMLSILDFRNEYSALEPQTDENRENPQPDPEFPRDITPPQSELLRIAMRSSFVDVVTSSCFLGFGVGGAYAAKESRLTVLDSSTRNRSHHVIICSARFQ